MRTLTIAGIALALAPVAAVSGQTVLPPNLAKMDTNKDGKLSLAEFSADRPTLFKRIDADKSGLISLAETTAYYLKIAPADDPKTAGRISGITKPDLNGDGTSLAELIDATAVDFRRRDKNGDGFIGGDDQ